MKRIILLAVSILSGAMLHAQVIDDSIDAQSLYEQAYEAAVNGEFDKMKPLLDRGVQGADGELLKEYYFLYGYLSQAEAEPYYNNDPERAYGFYEKASDYYLKSGNKEWWTVALKHMGVLKTMVNKYQDALQVWEFALEYADKTQTTAIEIMIYKKDVHEKLNQYDDAAKLASELRQVYGTVGDPVTKAKINIYFAHEALVAKNYTLARAHFDELDKLMPAMSQEYRDYYNHQVLWDKHFLLVYEEKYNEAADLMISYIAQIETMNPEPHTICALYIHLANDYAELKNKSLAVDALNKVVDLLSKHNFSDIEKSHQYLSVASVYKMIGMLKEALQYIEKSKETGVINDNLLIIQANVLYESGRLKDARNVYEAYSAYMATHYSKHSLQYAKSLWNLANINAFCKDFSAASNYYIAAVELAGELFVEGYRYISVSERESFWRDFSRLFSEMTSFGLAAGFKQDEFTRSAYNVLLLSKGLLLSSDKSLAKIVYDSGDEELVRMFERSKNLNTEIEVYKATGENESGRIAKMYDELHSMELELQKYAGLGDEYTAFLDVDYKDIASALKENEVVVDFTDFRGKKDPGKVFYAAFVYRKGWEYPKMLKVFEGEEIEAVAGPGMSWDVYNEKAEDLAKLLFKPLKKYIDSGDVIHWVPSGDLHKVSVESLLMQVAPDAGVTLRQLSSARMILNDKTMSGMHSAVLYGGLEYSGGDSAQFKELPESYDEVCLVKDILEAAEYNVKVLGGLAGTEQSLSEYSSKSPGLIHFSTHGFYYSPDDAESVNALSGFKNAMFLSGLILSGGNEEWENANHDDMGGVMTADDISKLDLSATDLVVLSACETAQGQVTAEGVYGLQRAFKKAGVNEIVMTLWHVNDIVSKEFMTEFYTGLVRYDFKADLALLHAKKTFRDAGYDPYYWAGYVLLD